MGFNNLYITVSGDTLTESFLLKTFIIRFAELTVRTEKLKRIIA